MIPVHSSLYQYLWVNGRYDYNSSEWIDGSTNQKFQDWAWQDSSRLGLSPIQERFSILAPFFRETLVPGYLGQPMRTFKSRIPRFITYMQLILILTLEMSGMDLSDIDNES